MWWPVSSLSLLYSYYTHWYDINMYCILLQIFLTLYFIHRLKGIAKWDFYRLIFWGQLIHLGKNRQSNIFLKINLILLLVFLILKKQPKVVTLNLLYGFVDTAGQWTVDTAEIDSTVSLIPRSQNFFEFPWSLFQKSISYV